MLYLHYSPLDYAVIDGLFETHEYVVIILSCCHAAAIVYTITLRLMPPHTPFRHAAATFRLIMPH